MIYDSANAWTEAELRDLERQIAEIYSTAYKELQEKWERSLEKMQEAEKPYIAELEKAEASGDKAEIKKAKKRLARIRRQYTVESDFYKNARDRLALQLANLDSTAYAIANSRLPKIYSVNYNVLAEGLPTGYAYGLITPETVHNLLLKQINLVKNTAWNARLMNEQVLQGILQGESIDKIAARFQTVFGMNRRSARTNARTAVTYAQNKGRYDSFGSATKNGTILVKHWSATHDKRTRDSHMDIDGEEVEYEKEFSNGLQFPGDTNGRPEEVYNCRCAMSARILGFIRKDGSISWVNYGR